LKICSSSTQLTSHFKKQIYLFTSVSGDKVVKANQDALEQLFYIRGLVYEPVDAVDPVNKELRTDLFSVSGLRAQYPQVFIKGRDGSCRFIGQYEEIQRLNERDELTYDWQDMFAKVNMFYDDEETTANGYFVEGNEEEEELKEAAEKTPVRARIIPQDLEGEALSDAAHNYLQKMQLLSSSKKKKHEYQMFPRESEQQEVERGGGGGDNSSSIDGSTSAYIESAIGTLSSYAADVESIQHQRNEYPVLPNNDAQVEEIQPQEAPAPVIMPLPPQWSSQQDQHQTPIKGQLLPPPPLQQPSQLPPPLLPPPPFPSASALAQTNSSSTPAPKASNPSSSIAETSTPFLSPRSRARRRAGDWEQCTTSTGETFYFKRTTGESSWVDPRGAILESVLDAGSAIEDPVWLPMKDSKGRTYFYNRTTGKSSWKKT
jgi:hypothetical protein